MLWELFLMLLGKMLEVDGLLGWLIPSSGALVLVSAVVLLSRL